MKGLIVFFIRRPVTVIMTISAVGIAAVFAFTVLPLDRLPELSVPMVTVETVYPGMAAEDIRSLVTIPVEDAFSSVKGLVRIQSVSRDNSSLISLDFRWGTDPVTACALVREAVDAVYPSLPQGVCKPSISPGDHDPRPHAVIAVRSLSDDRSIARRLADYEIRSRLRRIDGVGSIHLAGGEVKEGRLYLDIPRLAALGLSPSEFARLLAGETSDIPAGNAAEGSTELVVVSSGKPGSMEELARLVLPSPSAPLDIGNTGKISVEAGRKKSIFVYDGKEAAALEIYRRPGADPISLSKEIRKALREMDTLFSHNAEIVLIRDSAPFLVKSMISLAVSAVLGAAAVIGVLMVFIRRFRSGLLAALSIPVSASAGIGILAVTGRSLNSMSLGGLALGIGLVSDIAVIMLDLLNRHFGNFAEKPSPGEIGERAASITGSGIASTVTTAVVFIPVIFLPGPLGSLFGDTAIALVSSIAAGWLYAQFCIPSLYRYTFTCETVSGISPWFRDIEYSYRKLLKPVMRNPRKWYLIAGLASVLGALILLMRPAAFVSPDSAEEILVSVDFRPGTIPESIAAFGEAFSGRISGLTCIKTVYGRAGAEDDETGRKADMNYRREELIIHCIPEKGIKPEKTIPVLQNAVKDFIFNDCYTGDISLLPYPENFSVYLPKDRTSELLGLSSVLTYAVRGKDREESRERSGLIVKKFRDENYTGTVKLRHWGTRPELRLFPNRETAAYFGVSAADMAQTLYVINEGFVTTNLEIEGRPLDVRVMGDPASWNITGESLENIPVKTAGGKTIFLGSLGRIERREADAVLARLDRGDVIYMDLPHEKPVMKAAGKLSDTFAWFFRADESAFGRYRNALLLYVVLALVLIYMTMGAQFESFLLPLILMLSIPFSLAGAGPALLLFNSRLDSGAVLGLSALFGLVVNNGLILFEISEERIRCGYSPVLAVYGGASIRMRPVLVTALTTIFALLPVALNPLGSAQKSMAAAMLGGLTVSTVLSLFILPPVFVRFFRWSKNR